MLFGKEKSFFLLLECQFGIYTSISFWNDEFFQVPYWQGAFTLIPEILKF